MRALNYWEQFLSTGRIKDYLAYRENENVPENKISGGKMPEHFPSRNREKEGRGEGADQCYRDGIENRACWRV